MTTLEQFLAGEALRYKSLSGLALVADWRRDRKAGVAYLEIRRAKDGAVLMTPLYSRDQAEQFFNTVEQRHDPA